MSDTPPIAARSSGRWLAALVALAFVAGLTLMGYAARHWQWFGSGASATGDAAPQAALATQPAPVVPSLAPEPVAAPAVIGDTAALASREATLAGQLSALEARTATVSTDAAAAAAQAGRAEALLVAVAARRQVDRGQPLGYLEEQLRERFGQSQPRAVAMAIAAARQPVTLDALVAGLDARTPALMAGPQDDFLDKLRRELGDLVVLRRAGAASPLPADRLAHARQLLVAGQVERARDEVAMLPGAPVANDWLVASRRWVIARQALDALENAALTVPAPVVTPGAATTTTVLP